MTIPSKPMDVPTEKNSPIDAPVTVSVRSNAFQRPLAIALMACRHNNAACTPVHNRGVTFLA